MTEAVRGLLTAFDELSPTEKKQVLEDILRRSSEDEGLSDAALCELATELFRSYDAEESAPANS